MEKTTSNPLFFFKKFLFALIMAGFWSNSTDLSAQVSVSAAASSTPHASSMLDVQSTTKGVLVPRMTSAQRTAIASPAKGLMVFDNTTNTFWFHNGTAWTEMKFNGFAPGTGIDITGNTISNTGDTDPADDLTIASTAGGDISGNFSNLQIAADAIGSPEITDGSIAATDLAAGVIPTTLPPSGAAGGDLSGNYPNPDIAADAIGSPEIADGSIAATDLAAGVIPTTLPPSGAAGGDLSGNYPNPVVAANAIASPEITDGSVGTADLADGGIGTADLAAGAVTTAKIGSTGATSGKVLTADGAGGTTWSTQTLVQDNDANTKVETEKNANENLVRISLNGSEKVVFRANRIDLLNNGGSNAFVGENTGAANTGFANTGFGHKAMESNTSGFANTGIGEFALRFGTTGSYNTAVGGQSLYNNNGERNTAVGQGSLHANTTGSRNSALGEAALISNTTGNDNVAVGKDALRVNTTGYQNVAIGRDAGKSNTTGWDNVFVGRNAGANSTTAIGGTFVGQGAGFSNTTGGGNSFFGNGAGSGNTTGFSNTCVGFNAGTSMTTPNSNTIMGAWTAWHLTTGVNNTFIGAGAADAATTGSDNAFLGVAAGSATTTGNQNTYLGRSAGGGNVTGSGNTFIGHRVGEAETGSNKLYIDNSGVATPLIWGDFAADRVGINRVATTNTLEVGGEASKASAGDWLANSDARLKKDIQPLDPNQTLEKLLALQGVTYRWNDDKTGMPRPTGVQYGFTAQNIQSVFPELVKPDALGYLQTAYGTYDAMLIESIRALNQRIAVLETEKSAILRQFESLRAEVQDLKAVRTGK